MDVKKIIVYYKKLSLPIQHIVVVFLISLSKNPLLELNSCMIVIPEDRLRFYSHSWSFVVLRCIIVIPTRGTKIDGGRLFAVVVVLVVPIVCFCQASQITTIVARNDS